MVPPFKKPRLDEPQLFYLGTSGLDELADGRIKHGEVVLPFHSQVLATQSSVLRDLFRSLCTTKDPAIGAEMIELETPFKDFALEEVIFFLRFVYHTIDATAANFELAAAHAPGVIRLAHSLDVSGLLMAAADEYVGYEMTGTEAALNWLPLAETCGLENAWSHGIRVLAVDLLNGEGGSHGAHVAVRELSSVLSQDSILAVLAAVASASRKTSLLSEFDVPAASLLAHWRAADLQPGDGEYTYILTEFSKQQSPMLSPEFEAAGYTWRLQVELDDDKLGLHLLSSTATSFPIVYTLKLINQLTGEVYSQATSDTFADNDLGGFTSFIELNVLRFIPGYIVDDTVEFRVDISTHDYASAVPPWRLRRATTSAARYGASFKKPRLDEPQLFYLGTSGLDELADGRIRHGEVVLPFHSQVLATQSSVLRDLFRSLRTTKDPAVGAEMIELETPFKDFTLEEVVYFLWFVYCTIDATAANFRLASAHAPGVIRLAHFLSVAGPLMAAANKFIGKKMTSIEAALKWLPLTETCHLHHAWSLGIRVLAVDLSTGNGGFHTAHVAVQKLSSTLSKCSFAAVIAAVATACRSSDRAVPSADLLAHWKAADLQPGDGEYTYNLTEFSKLSSPVLCPEFEAAGYKWQLRVKLDDDKVGFFLLSSTATSFPISYTLELLDQVGAFYGWFRFAFICLQEWLSSPIVLHPDMQLTGEVYSRGIDRRTFAKPTGWGFSSFVELKDLRSTPGYIVDDTVQFRVRISLDDYTLRTND
ncbi:hypothetical protein ACK3TF_001964 [Chlorella vulgaris]